MPQTNTLRHDRGMRRTALRVLQVSAAYFALGTAVLPSVHQPPVQSAPPISKRLAAGAWPMIGLPTPAPRKRKGHAAEHSRLQFAANDEKI